MSQAKRDYDIKNLWGQSSADHVVDTENKSKAMCQIINIEKKTPKNRINSTSTDNH